MSRSAPLGTRQGIRICIVAPGGLGGSGLELRHVVHGYDVAAAFGADVVHDHTFIGLLYALQIAAVIHRGVEAWTVRCADVGGYYAAIAPRSAMALAGTANAPVRVHATES